MPSGRTPHPSETWIARKCGQSGPWASPEAVRAWQLRALRNVCRRVAATSRFYRRLFAPLPRDALERGSWPAGFAEFAEAPFTWPRDVSADWRQFLCVGGGEVARMVSLETSGTTYLPKRVAFTAADLERIVDYFAAGVGQMVRSGDTVLILLPGAERPAGVTDLLTRALTRLGATGVPGSPTVVVDGFLEELERHGPECLVAAPGQLSALAVDARVRDAVAGRVRAILSCTSSLPPEVKTRLAAEWDTRIIEYYGMTESGYGGGVECFFHNGYHVNEADLYFEVVDPGSGLPLPDGAPGEVVFTTLNREAMPLVRYRTGDFAAMLPGPCACGSAMRRLGPVRGRIARRRDGYDVISVEKGLYSARHVDGDL